MTTNPRSDNYVFGRADESVTTTAGHMGEALPERHGALIEVLRPALFLQRMLHEAGVTTVGELAACDPKDFDDWPNVGPRKAEELLHLWSKAHTYLSSIEEKDEVGLGLLLPAADRQASKSTRSAAETSQRPLEADGILSRDTVLTRLAPRGIDAGTPWSAVLPGLPTRVVNILIAQNFETLGQVLDLVFSQPDGKMAGSLINRNGRVLGPYGQTSLMRTLRDAIERVLVAEPSPLVVGASQPKQKAQQLLRELEKQGIASDARWSRIFGVLPLRMRDGLHEHGLETVGELVDCVFNRAAEVRKWENIGSTSLHATRKVIEAVATLGHENFLYEGPTPASIEELYARMIGVLSEREREILVRHYIEDATLKEIAEPYALTRQRVQQIIVKVLHALHNRFGALAQKLLEPLLSAIGDGGGLIHSSRLERDFGITPLGKVRFCLEVATDRPTYLWRQTYLTLNQAELETAIDGFRTGVKAVKTSDLSWGELQRILEASTGMSLTAEPLREFARVALQGEFSATGIRPHRSVQRHSSSPGYPQDRHMWDDIEDILSGRIHPVRSAEIVAGLIRRGYPDTEKTRRKVHKFTVRWSRTGRLVRSGIGFFQLPAGGDSAPRESRLEVNPTAKAKNRKKSKGIVTDAKSEPVRERKAERKAEAKAMGGAILAVLAARELAVSHELEARIRATTDLDTLNRWIQCVVTAVSAEALLEVPKD